MTARAASIPNRAALPAARPVAAVLCAGLLAAFAGALGLSGCAFGSGSGTPVGELEWEGVAELDATLPPGIRVFRAQDPAVPLRAWHVRVDEPDPTITTRVVVGDDADGLETLTELADGLGARVVVNGGYFRTDVDPVRHVGLLYVDGRTVSPATPSVLRGDRRYYVARAALGLGGGGVDVAWVSSDSGRLLQWPEPPANAPGRPVPEPDLEVLEEWVVRDALAAGPALVADGRARVTVDEEVFFGTTIPDAHPRTAACVLRDGALVLMVVDGRQSESRGVDLEELASILVDLGCVEGLNLDGGGSSALVVDGARLNRPLGGTVERPVMSALAVFEEE